MNFPLLEVLNIKIGCFPPRQMGLCTGQLPPHTAPCSPLGYRNVQMSVTHFSRKSSFSTQQQLGFACPWDDEQGESWDISENLQLFSCPSCLRRPALLHPSQSSCPDVPVLQLCSITANLRQCVPTELESGTRLMVFLEFQARPDIWSTVPEVRVCVGAAQCRGRRGARP